MKNQDDCITDAAIKNINIYTVKCKFLKNPSQVPIAHFLP